MTLAPTADTSTAVLAGAGSGHARVRSAPEPCTKNTRSSAEAAALVAASPACRLAASAAAPDEASSVAQSAPTSTLALRTASRTLLLTCCCCRRCCGKPAHDSDSGDSHASRAAQDKQLFSGLPGDEQYRSASQERDLSMLVVARPEHALLLSLLRGRTGVAGALETRRPGWRAIA